MDISGKLTTEDNVLERLNTEQTIHGLLSTAIVLATEAVNVLILQIFRKDDYAVKYAVEPLLNGTGPLSTLSVRLKLIYALGIISRAEYEDLELLMALLDELNRTSHRYQFTDDEIFGPISLLHDMVLPPLLKTNPPTEGDNVLFTMQQQRNQQMLRSSLVLAINDLLLRIINKKAF